MASGFSTAKKVEKVEKQIVQILIACEHLKTLGNNLNDRLMIIEKEIKDNGK